MSDLLDRIILERRLKAAQATATLRYKSPDVCMCQNSDYLSSNDVDNLIGNINMPTQDLPSPSSRHCRLMKKNKQKVYVCKKNEIKRSTREVFFDTKTKKWILSVRHSRNTASVVFEYEAERYGEYVNAVDYSNIIKRN